MEQPGQWDDRDRFVRLPRWFRGELADLLRQFRMVLQDRLDLFRPHFTHVDRLGRDHRLDW